MSAAVIPALPQNQVMPRRVRPLRFRREPRPTAVHPSPVPASPPAFGRGKLEAELLSNLFATTPFRATTSTTLFGFWTVPNTAITLTGIPSDPAVRAEIIIGVWDNQGGTITSWDQLYDPATRRANVQYSNVPRGTSQPFVEQDQLGGGTVLPATLKGLQSFQLYYLPPGDPTPLDPIYHVPVPEPSTFVIILLGACGVLWFPRMSRRRQGG